MNSDVIQFSYMRENTYFAVFFSNVRTELLKID